MEKAEQIADRQVERYPAIRVSHVTRTALRKAGIPAIQLVVMPPRSGIATMLLMSNIEPQESREFWQDILDPESPFIWRNYQLTRGKHEQITWRLSTSIREHYRERIARLITGRGGAPEIHVAPAQLSPETARIQVEGLARHLGNYPGFSGIRADVYSLARYSTKVWKSTHPEHAYPVWPTMPYTRFTRAKMLPLSNLTTQETEQ